MPTFRIIRPIDLRPKPSRYEERVAELCAEWFQSDISFVVRSHHTSPDILVVRTNQFWEIKNIRGCGKHTIEDNLRKASKQSQNIIISLLVSAKMNTRTAEGRIKQVLQAGRMPIKHVLLITKTEKIIDVK